MKKNRLEKEITIFGKGTMKNTIISSGNKEDSPPKNNEKLLNFNIKVNKRPIRKETSLRQVRSPTNTFNFKNNNSPKKNTPSINGNISKKK